MLTVLVQTSITCDEFITYLGCRKPNGVDFLGNSFAAGSSIRLKCDGDKVFPISVTCLVNGTWDIDQSVCKKHPNTPWSDESYYNMEPKNMTWLEAKVIFIHHSIYIW